MAIDTPARLAILGAGPIGLEAALYARFLGYDVVVFERGEIAASVRRWGHVRMFTPFHQNSSPLGLAALAAQDEQFQPPDQDAYLTASEWIERYLAPLAATDLLSDHLRLNTEVLAIGKEELLWHDVPSPERPADWDRGDWSFRVLVRNPAGAENIETFDGVLDCLGAYQHPNWLGHGGIPAMGEQDLAPVITYHIPDVLGRDRSQYAGKHTLLVGAGTSAATTALALAELAQAAAGTEVTWITRREGPAATGPIAVISNDPLPRRAELVSAANRLALSNSTAIRWRGGAMVERLERLPAGRIRAELSGEGAAALEVDRIVANVGYRADRTVADALRIDDPPPRGIPAATFATGEPNYYVLGAKSYGRRPDFLYETGLGQIRDVFAILGDRATLDLYASAVRLPR